MRQFQFERLGRWIGIGISTGLLAQSICLGSTFYQQPFPKTVEEAPVILKGTIGSHYSDRGTGNDSNVIYTYYEFRNEETIKSQASIPPQLLIRELGGEKDGVGMQVAGTAHFENRESVVVMLQPTTTDGVMNVHGMMLGKLNIETNSNGDEVLKGPALWENQTSAEAREKQRIWTLNDLRQLIKKQSKSMPPQTKAPEHQKEISKVTEPTKPSAMPNQGTALPQTNPEDSDAPNWSLVALIIIGAIGVIITLWKLIG